MTSRLAQVLTKLDALVDWERRDRAQMRVDVEPTRDLLRRLGQPQRKFRAIHVAGTKGKGSVCAIIEAGMKRAGVRCGRYASPHVQRVNERISIDCRDIDDETLSHMLERTLAAREAARAEGTPAGNASWFDVWTAAAFLALAEAGVTWAAVECGIGGKLDSTNALDGDIAVLTNVDLEHTALLGRTHAAIARDKLGILKVGKPLVTGVAPESEAGKVVEEVAQLQGSPVVWVKANPGAMLVDVNLGIANAALEMAGVAKAPRPVADQLKLPGRMEVIEPSPRTGQRLVVLDGAHVPSNLRAVLRDLQRDTRFARPCVVVIGVGRDKVLDALLTELRALKLQAVIATATRDALPPHEPNAIATRATALLQCPSDAIEPANAAIARALTLAERSNAWVLVTGSLHLIGQVRAGLAPV